MYSRRRSAGGSGWSVLGDTLSSVGEGLEDYEDMKKAEAEKKEQDRQAGLDDYERSGRWDEKRLGKPPAGKANKLKMPMYGLLGSGATMDVDASENYFREEAPGVHRDIRKTLEFQDEKVKRIGRMDLTKAQIDLRRYGGPGLDGRDKTEIEGVAQDAGSLKEMMAQRMGDTRQREEEALRNERERKEQADRDALLAKQRAEDREDRQREAAIARRLADRQGNEMDEQRARRNMLERATTLFSMSDGDVKLAMQRVNTRLPNLTPAQRLEYYDLLQALAAERKQAAQSQMDDGRTPNKVSPRASSGGGADWQGALLNDDY